jgi:transcriptional regulator with XRE-family HTH domain
MTHRADSPSRPETPRELRGAIGARILRLRQGRRWTQRKLGQRIGAKVERISRLENGHSAPVLVELVRLSEAFGVSLDELVKGQPPAGAARATPFSKAVQRLERVAEPDLLQKLTGWVDGLVDLSETLAALREEADAGRGGGG